MPVLPEKRNVCRWQQRCTSENPAGGSIVKIGTSVTCRSIVVAIDSRRQPAFMARLDRLGKVRGEPVILEQPAGEQLLTIKLLTVSVAP